MTEARPIGLLGRRMRVRPSKRTRTWKDTDLEVGHSESNKDAYVMVIPTTPTAIGPLNDILLTKYPALFFFQPKNSFITRKKLMTGT